MLVHMDFEILYLACFSLFGKVHDELDPQAFASSKLHVETFFIEMQDVVI